MALHALARNPEQEGQVKLFIPWRSVLREGPQAAPLRARGRARAPGRGLLRERPLQPAVHAPRPARVAHPRWPCPRHPPERRGGVEGGVAGRAVRRGGDLGAGHSQATRALGAVESHTHATGRAGVAA